MGDEPEVIIEPPDVPLAAGAEAKKPSLLMRALNVCYDAAVDGLGPLASAADLAAEYRTRGGSLEQQIDSLIRWQISKAGMAGLATGMGGLVTLPITVPANLASVMLLQVRMIAAIAVMTGHDLREDRVKSLVFACLLGNEIKDLVKEVGVMMAKNAATRKLEQLALARINQRVGVRLAEKTGEKGASGLARLVPLIGGVISGSLDAAATWTIGRIAKKIFLQGS